jgi:chemotaxis protein histidine kinase CheA
MDAEFDDLKREFLVEAEEKVREIQNLLDGGSESRESLDRMLYLSHQLKGAGGSYGFARISTEAAAIEGALEKWVASNLQPKPEMESRMAALTAEVALRARELAPPSGVEGRA